MGKAISIFATIAISIVILTVNTQTCSNNKIIPLLNSGHNQRCVEDFDGHGGLGDYHVYNPNLVGTCLRWETIPAQSMTDCNNFCNMRYQTQGCKIQGNICHCLEQLTPYQSMQQTACKAGMDAVYHSKYKGQYYPWNNYQIQQIRGYLNDPRLQCVNFGWNWRT